MPPGIGYGGPGSFAPQSSQYSPQAQAFGQQIGSLYPSIDPSLLSQLGASSLNSGSLSPLDAVPIRYHQLTGGRLPSLFSQSSARPPATPQQQGPSELEMFLMLPNASQLLTELGLGGLIPQFEPPRAPTLGIGDLIGATQNPTDLLSMLLGGRR